MTCDPFEILGLTKGATKREIKHSYRLLSKQFHPDLNRNEPGSEARFREIQWAYEMLSGTEDRDNSKEAEVQHRQQPHNRDWSEKPFAGFFWSMKAYVEQNKSRSCEDSSRDSVKTSDEHEE
jgi:DnaJ-class molecular chaperone